MSVARAGARSSHWRLFAVLSLLPAGCGGHDAWRPEVGLVTAIDISPSWGAADSLIAYVRGPRSHGDSASVSLLNVRTGTSEVLSRVPPTTTAVALSPSGERVAVIRDGDLWTLHAATGSWTRHTFAAPYVRWPVWNGDTHVFVTVIGKRAAEPDSAWGLRRIELATGRHRVVRDAGGAPLLPTGPVGVEPGADTVVVGVAAGQSTRIVRGDGHSGTWNPVAVFPGAVGAVHCISDHEILFDGGLESTGGRDGPHHTWHVDRRISGIRRWHRNLGSPEAQFGFPFDVDCRGTYALCVAPQPDHRRGVVWIRSVHGSDDRQLTSR